MDANAKTERPMLTVINGKGYGQKEDAELIMLCQKNKDQAAFEVLVRRYQRTVYALLYKMAPDWTDIADLAQEAFIRMWRGIDKLQNPKAFRSWLSQIVTNLFYDELRKRPRRTPILSLDQAIGDDEEGPTRDIPDPSAGPDDLVHRKDVREMVEEAISELPKQFRTAIILREIQDLPYDEIARITNTDLGTVKSRIARARAKIQTKLRPMLVEDDRRLSA
ncbi:MAG TPA: sigma-70 family RNA polymerase sigma factor [Planktothrix sp.]|jgi:RNA polymerase sigma-70 factor (ECF subfamily)